ncbi:MAG: YfhO family protein, partial [Actinomycetota bacterium]|nr:YfhO family protein [Actinomycetota bacterium]
MNRAKPRVPTPSRLRPMTGGGAVPGADFAAVAAVLLLTAIGAWGLVVGGTTVGMDAATQFYPWYSFLGESLRSFEIPGWNPHQFSGVPFAADPLSGWSYLPAMGFFTFLPLSAAAKTYLIFHLLLAGLSAYALARALGIGAAGALFSAVSYEYGSFLYTENTCCFAYASVMAWLPLALLGAEMAIRSPRKLDGAAWLGLSGLALSQILGSWLGQGSYYALLALGGYVGYRTLISPPAHLRGVRERLLGAVLHGGAVLLFGFGLAAAGLLPRLEYNALSNLAGGYLVEEGAGAVEIGGWEREDWHLLLEPGLWYAGGATVALALLAVPLARGRFGVPYFAGLSLSALVLSGQGPTPLHSALYLLPRFDQLHPHSPERVVMLLYLGLALLAGAALSRLGEMHGNSRSLLFLPVALLAVVLAGSLAPSALVALVLAGAILVAYTLLPSRRGPLLALLVAVVFLDLLSSGRAAISSQGDVEGWVGISGITRKMDLADYYRPSGALRFLMSREGQFRYFGFGLRTPEGRTISSPTRFAHPETQALGVGNRATTVGLQSLQGYNAVHLAHYDEYFAVMNGGNVQDYHHADVLREGPESPLLDILGARYVVVPTDPLPKDREYLRKLEREFPVVYEDGRTKVLENREALPRAWVVHRARRADDGDASKFLESGAARPLETALLETEPPGLDPSASPSDDRASVTAYEADRVEIEAATGGAGLLVLGEVYYPAWRAYVDGEPAPLYRADGLLRAVALPAGEHTVELRYESRTLRVGTAVSLVTCSTLVALGVFAGARRRRGGA